MADIQPGSVETTRDFGEDDGAFARRWLAELKASEKHFRGWVEESKKITRRYREERDTTQHADNQIKRIAMLWSNIETVRPLLYSQRPVAEVVRRFKDRDPVGLTAAEITERGMSYLLDVAGPDDAFKSAVLDYQISARGQIWVRYEPTYGDRETDPESGEEFEPVVDEKVCLEHIHFSDFRHSPSPNWGKVWWVSRRVLMTRDRLVKRFGDKGKEIPLDHKADGWSDDDGAEYGDVFKRAEVWEIWNRITREVIWVSPGYQKGVLDRQKDPLRLRNFFPCPRPCYGTLTTDSLIPVPDYLEWKSQAEEMDTLTERISLLTEALRVAGAYDAEHSELGSLLSSIAENKLIPVEDWSALMSKGGLEGVMDFLPIEETSKVLTALVAVREQVKEDLYEITGIADVIRGASDKDETAAAQKIKSRFASLRLEDKQREVQRFVRDTIEIMAEIMVEHFSPETLMMVSNYPYTIQAEPQVFAEALKLLKDDRLRTFRVDIETDSTIAPNRDDEQRRRNEFLAAVTPYLKEAIPAAKDNPGIGKMLGEILMFMVRGYSTGRQLEQVFEQTLEGMGEQQQPEMPPELQEKMARLELEKAKEQNRVQLESQKIEIEKGKLEIEMARLAMEQKQAEVEVNKATVETRAGAEDRAQKLEMAYQEMEQKRAELTLKQQELEIKKAESEAKLAIETEKLAETRQAREDERLDRDMDREPHVEIAETWQVMQDVGEGLRDVIGSFVETARMQNEAIQQTLEKFSEAANRMADAAMAPKQIIKNAKGEIVGAKVMTPGSETVQ